MSTDDKDLVPEEQAREIWRRAVELQMEAARHEQERALTSGDGDGADPRGGLSLDAVRAAALEAGISEEFVSLAVAEQTGSVSEEKALTGWKDRAATRTLGSDLRVLEVVDTVPVSPADFLEALKEVAPRPPYLLSLRDTIGDDPLNGGVLVFQAPGMGEAGSNRFSRIMATVEIREIRLSIRAVEGGHATEARIQVPLTRARRMNWWASTAISGIVGGGTGIATLAIGLAAGAALPVALGILALGTAGGVGGSRWGIGKAYRWGLRQAELEFLGLIRSVKVTARLGPGFTPRREDMKSGSGSGMDDLTLSI